MEQRFMMSQAGPVRHEYAILRHHGGMPFPPLIHCERAQHERGECVGNGRMDPKQNNSALFEGLTALHRACQKSLSVTKTRRSDSTSSSSAASFAPG